MAMSRGAKEACSPRFQPCSGRKDLEIAAGSWETSTSPPGTQDHGEGNRESAVRMAGDARLLRKHRKQIRTGYTLSLAPEHWLLVNVFMVEKPIISFINSYQRRVRRFPFPSNRRGSSPQMSLCPALYLHKERFCSTWLGWILRFYNNHISKQLYARNPAGNFPATRHRIQGIERSISLKPEGFSGRKQWEELKRSDQKHYHWKNT